jgi:hypothetical protein
MPWTKSSSRATLLTTAASTLLLASALPSSAQDFATPEGFLTYSGDVPDDVVSSCFSLELQDRIKGAEDEEQRLRIELGLDAAPSNSATDLRYNTAVTVQESANLDRSVEVLDKTDRKELLRTSMQVAGDSFVGMHWDIRELSYIVTVDSKLDTRIIQDTEGIKVRVLPGAPTRVESDQALKIIGGQRDVLTSLGVEGWHYDETCGVMTVTILEDFNPTPVKDFVSELLGDYPVLYKATSESANRPTNRTSYHNPYIGGTRLTVGSGGCTSSIGWYKGSEKWGVVAAHCLGSQPGYTSGSFTTVARDWIQGGTEIDISSGPSTTYFVYGGKIDQAIVQLRISNSNQTITYDPNTGSDTIVSMGWWDWDLEQGGIGELYCQAGTGINYESCGTLIRRNGVNNYNPSSTFGVPIYLDGLWVATNSSTDGDSGGSWWRREGASRWLAGVQHGKDDGDPAFTHVSYLKSTFGLTAPVGMS